MCSEQRGRMIDRNRVELQCVDQLEELIEASAAGALPADTEQLAAANLISADVYLGRGRQGKPRNVVNQTRQSLSQSALRAALMTPMKDMLRSVTLSSRP